MGVDGPHGAVGAKCCMPGAHPFHTVPGDDGSSTVQCNVRAGVGWARQMERRSAGGRSDSRMMNELVKQQEALHEDVLRRLAAKRTRSREATIKGVLPAFHVEDYVWW